jgi:predicted RNA-binding Zn ribbon-like protein
MMAGNLADLRVVGGHPALDLANTVAPRPPGAVEFEFLHEPDALLRWALRADVVDQADAERIERSWSRTPGSAEDALADVLALRALLEPVLAGHDLDTLTGRWATAISRSALRPVSKGETGCGVLLKQALVPVTGGKATLVIGTEPATMIGDRLADAMVDLVRNADLGRLRACPLVDGGCGWLFLDRSRNLSRRWCSMDDCGTHAKSRRLTERRRGRR